jgi:hypothetical protein
MKETDVKQPQKRGRKKGGTVTVDEGVPFEQVHGAHEPCFRVHHEQPPGTADHGGGRRQSHFVAQEAHGGAQGAILADAGPRHAAAQHGAHHEAPALHAPHLRERERRRGGEQ